MPSSYMPFSTNGMTVHLSPRKRGAADRMASVLSEVVNGPGSLLVASQQVSDPELIGSIARSLERSSERGKVILEGQYLRERSAAPSHRIWDAAGRFEPNRQGLLALLRAGLDVRPDYVTSALQHANFIVRSGSENPTACLTSANFAKGSIHSHYNWALTTTSRLVSSSLKRLFRDSWDGDFRDAAVRGSEELGEGATLELAGGADNQSLELLSEMVSEARSSLKFAFFNISTGAPALDAFTQSQGRGVQISGVVDGDQSRQPWDAVPILRGSGVDARYYPGAMTGGSGRMHYKMVSVDGQNSYLGTANISASAEKSLELGLVIRGAPGLAEFIANEILRLWPLARTTALFPIL